MYSENNRRSASRRADDDFLRRMLGGELVGDARYEAGEHGNACQISPAIPHAESRLNCRGELRPSAGEGACPTHLHAPALAMVYSPMQCWRQLYDPKTALAHGTLFEELDLPLEVVSKPREREVMTRRPF